MVVWRPVMLAGRFNARKSSNERKRPGGTARSEGTQSRSVRKFDYSAQPVGCGALGH
jgi:hypothetical protein